MIREGPASWNQSFIPLPNDPCLPSLPAILDGSQVAHWLGEALGSPCEEAIPRYLRYKPASKAMVLYEVTLDGRHTTAVISIKVGNVRRELRLPAAADVERQARGRCLSPTPIQFLQEPGALVEWYPARVSMPGLAFDPGRLGRELEAAGQRRPEEEPALVSYKPERRAVQRWGDIYVKSYIDAAEYVRASSAALTARLTGIESPVPVAHIDQDKLLALAEVRRVGGAAVPREVGAVVARLHGAKIGGGLRRSPAADQLTLARTTAAQVAWLLPELQGPLRELVSSLVRSLPVEDQFVTSHGDLHLGQIIPTAAGLTLLDFDHMCLAAPARDAATLAAHLVEGGEDDLVRAESVLDDLLEGYGRVPAAIGWHLAAAILGRATFPLRQLRPDWPSRIARMVTDAARAACRGSGGGSPLN
jgi:hypothetical protein